MDGSFPNAIDQMNAVFRAQKKSFSYESIPTLKQRKDDLDRFVDVIRKYQDDIVEAVRRDYGVRSPMETRSSEVAMAVGTAHFLKKRLRRLMAPKRNTHITSTIPGRTYLRHVPKGVVGIVSPWNYPIQLTAVPVATALAAGNRMMVKTSEMTPNTSTVFKQLIGEAFDETQVAIVEGGIEVGEAFSALPFDHLFFTGSTRVGRKVAEAAAKNLTPVTLELGGKSPCIVLPDTDLSKALPLIAQGKIFNAGQSCVAPDYLLVPASKEKEIAEGLVKTIQKFFPNIGANEDYSAMIADRSAARIEAMIREAQDAGADIHRVPMADEAQSLNKVAPAMVINPPLDSQMMREEVFGPILPIITYHSPQDAIEFVNSQERPLALYAFGEDVGQAKAVVDRTISGGAIINATIVHLAVEHLPFGGTGQSGYGAYHGERGFYEFSHEQSVLVFPKWKFLGKMITPPYGRGIKMITNWTIGGKPPTS